MSVGQLALVLHVQMSGRDTGKEIEGKKQQPN